MDFRDFRTPTGLRSRPAEPRQVLVIGSCAIGSLPHFVKGIPSGADCDFFNVNHGCILPSESPQPLDAYDFHIVQIPLRTLWPEARLMRLTHEDAVGHELLLADAKKALSFSIGNALRWSVESGTPAFVCNFLTPQQNPIGRLQPRYDLRNPVYFIEELNRHLAAVLADFSTAWLLDADQIAASIGRRYVQDDSMCFFSHGSILNDYDFDHDQDRLEIPVRATEQYGGRADQFLVHIYDEALAMFRTLRGDGSIKMVVVDLDDTLWRGVVAEGGEITPHQTEGWPGGVVEALLYLKRRGILIAALSRNDSERVLALWSQLYGGRMEVDDFAAWEVSWGAKAPAMQRLLDQVGLLPRSVVFVDDNPVERAAMVRAYPDMRVLGDDPYSLRRVLLWAPEAQVPHISYESSQRTTMVRAQVQRERARESVGAEEFLESLQPAVDFFEITDPADPQVASVLELINKTNQFNTTGERWSEPELLKSMSDGLRVFAFVVRDRYTAYGLVGALLLCDTTIEQMVMSCRVLGLGIEQAALAALQRLLGAQSTLNARLLKTDANGPARGIWPSVGFRENDDLFTLEAGRLIPVPPHVLMVFPTTSDLG